MTGIAQDHRGFMWFATQQGLLAFDGYEFTTYANAPLDSLSLSSDYTECIYVDRAGTLWVGTYGDGLNRFDHKTRTFERFKRDPDDPYSLSQDTVIAILEDHEGALWIGTQGGLNRFDRASGRFTRFRHDPENPSSLTHDVIRVLYEDRSGTLWVGTGDFDWHGTGNLPGGLNRFDRETGTFARFQHDPTNYATLLANPVHSILEDSRGTMWVGTADGGVHTMDRESGTFVRYRFDPGNTRWLSTPLPDGPAMALTTTFIHEDKSGKMWFGLYFGGLTQFDPGSGIAINHQTHAGDTIGNLAFWTIYESREGVLWVGTLDGALYKIDPSKNRFALRTFAAGPGGNFVFSLAEDEPGVYWIGTFGGLLREDRRSGEVTRYRHDSNDPRTLSSDAVNVVYKDPKGVVWAGTGAGLDRYDPVSERFVSFRYDPHDPQSLCVRGIRALQSDRNGRLWIGTWQDGLCRLDPATGVFTRYPRDPNDNVSPSLDFISDLLEDREGTLWIGTSGGGLNRFDPKTGRFTRYQPDVRNPSGLSGTSVSIHQDRQGTIWVGTSGGLSRMDSKNATFTHFTSQNSSLAGKFVASIVEDEEGDLWLATSEGIERFSPANNTFRKFDARHGIPPSTLTGRQLRTRSGEILIGATDGYYVVSPKGIKLNLHPPDVVLSAFKLAEREGTNETIPLRQVSIAESKPIRLAHTQNDFTFEFVGIHYSAPELNRYMVILEGYNESWRDLGAQRSATYFKVRPGQYTFRAKAANSDGIWSDDVALIRVVILPPWWHTWWFRLLAACSLLGLAYGGYRVRVRSLTLRSRVLERQVAERTAEVETQKTELEEHKIQLEKQNEALRSHEVHLERQNVLLAEQRGLAEDQAQKLQQLDELKGRFFSNISHEFRTPLTLILGPVRDAIRGVRPIDARELNLLYRNAQRLLRLINQLLDLSRLEAGGMRLNAHRADLVGFLRRIMLSFASRAERERIALSFQSDEDRLVLRFDPEKLEKVVFNLLSNAFKFTPEHGKIRLSLRAGADEEGDFVELGVKDTGQGIPSGELPHVFDRFYQADPSMASRHEGSGIGLALVKEFVELHHGEVRVESEIGFGTTVYVRLPYEEYEPTEPEDEVVEGHPIYAREMDENFEVAEFAESVGDPVVDQRISAPSGLSAAPLILIVEDNEDVRTYLRIQLEDDYRIAEACDGAAGLEMVRDLKPDLILSDVMMPRMDGIALTRAVRANGEIAHIPIVLLTAKADLDSRIEGFEEGADDYLPKPFDALELLARVESLIEIRQLLRRRFSGEVILSPSGIAVQSKDAAFLERVREVIESRMGDSSYNIDELASDVALSTRQLQRRLKDLTKLSAAGYIRMMRMERAAQLLEQGAAHVAEVAYRVGYKDADHFTKVFKQVYGVAPSAFARGIER